MLLSTVSKSHQVSVPTSKVFKSSMLCLLVGIFLFLALPSYKIKSPTQCDSLLVHSRLSRDVISGARQAQRLSGYSNFSVMGMGLSWPQLYKIQGAVEGTLHRVKGWSREAITTSWMPWPCRNLPDEVKEEGFPSWVKKWRGYTHNEGDKGDKGDMMASVGWLLQSSSVPVAHGYWENKSINGTRSDGLYC